jgi:fibronectin-binding autotransporter adhesin
MDLGSIEGGGIVSLGSKNLRIGGNNLSTLFSGVMRDAGFVIATGGTLTKVGTGTLELSGASTYTGVTRVLAGVLRVSGSLSGAVNVQGGTLGGNGTIGGGVVLGPGGVVAPGASIGSFSTAGLLTFDAGSAYNLEIDSGAGTADRISALNVSIGTDVDLFTQEIGSGALPMGLQFRIINNTSADPVSGFFSGLVEGASFPAGNNVFAISYRGGDGNDVVITSLLPEPSAISLLALGALLVNGSRRRPVLRSATANSKHYDSTHRSPGLGGDWARSRSSAGFGVSGMNKGARL